MPRLTIAIALPLLLLACGQKDETPVADVRPAIAVEYVRGDDLPVHAQPSDGSPIVTKYGNGESVSVLSRSNGWAEVCTANGSGWAKEEGLADAAASKQSEADNLTPRFRGNPPSPVTQPGATGEIVLEADVNPSGEVTSVRVVSNTTGSPALAAKNVAMLQGAKFHPIVQHGERKPFIYTHRVHY